MSFSATLFTYVLLAIVVVAVAAIYRSTRRRAHASVARRDVLRRTRSASDLPFPSAVAFDAVVVPRTGETGCESWYDVATLPSGLIAFSIGSIGAESGPTSSAVRAIFSESARVSTDPSEALALVNRRLFAASRSATALVGTIDPQTLEVVYASAGHAPPLFADGAGEAAFGEAGGFALGMMPIASYRTFARTMAAGEMAVLWAGSIATAYALGARDENLRKAVGAHAAAHTASPAKPILQDVVRTGPCDLTALVAIKFVGDPLVSDGPSGRTWKLDVRDAEAATRLRRDVITCVRRYAPETDTLASEIVIGELINEVLMNAPGPIDATLDWRSEPARFIVDHDGETSVARSPNAAFADRAEGRYLVNLLSEALRVTRTDGGRERIEVDLPQVEMLSSGRVRPGHAAAL